MPSTDSRHIFSDLDFTTDFEIRQQTIEELEAHLVKSPPDDRDALTSYIPEADTDQTAVIEATERTIRLVAPAGSGKTQTVVNRVLSRIAEGLNPTRILVLTFDNSAVGAISSKLDHQLKQANASLTNRPFISTLNAFGYHILRQYIPDEFRDVVPRDRSMRLIQQALVELGKKSKERYDSLPSHLAKRFYLEFFSLLKNELFDPRQFDSQALADFILERGRDAFFSSADPSRIKMVIQAVIWLYRAYETSLNSVKLIDFDDQKLRPYVYMSKDKQLLATLQRSFSEVIVDEFQDINKLDFLFVKSLSETANLMVVGDDDQAIYGFRGCSPDFIIDLQDHLSRQVGSYELRVNYRCPPNVVDHANNLIEHNKRRIPKNTIANRKDLAEIKIVSTIAAGLEARFAIKFMKRVLTANQTLSFRDFAILYRTNAQSLPLQIELILNNVPYFVREQDNILANEVLDRLLGVLRLKNAVNSKRLPNALDCAFTIRSYFRYLTPKDMEKLTNLFAGGASFLDMLQSKKFFKILPKAENSNLVRSVEEILASRSLMNTLELLAKNFHGLKGMVGSLEDVTDEKVPLGEIYELAANVGGTVEHFIQVVEDALRRAKSTNAGKRKDDGIALLTYFRAKGLQWHTVMLTTCNEGLIPHKRSPIEEERRLFYVAMTRASSNLLVSYVKKSCGNDVSPSRFLYEAGLLKK